MRYDIILGLPARDTEAPVEVFLDRRVDGMILVAPPVELIVRGTTAPLRR